MAKPHRPSIKQTDATRILKAYHASGYETVRLIVRPDGTIEAVGSNVDNLPPESANSWDEVLK